MIEISDYTNLVVLEDEWKKAALKSMEAFSKTLNKRVETVNNPVKIIPTDELPGILGADEPNNTVSCIIISGNVYGAILLSATTRDVLKLADILLHKEIGHFKDLSTENVSVINTIATLIAEYYIDSLVDLFGKNIKLRKAKLSTNPYKVIEYFGGQSIHNKEEDALIFETDFILQENDINGKTFLIFMERSVKRILKMIKK